MDVDAIRSWLVTQDPNDYRDSEGIWIERQLMEPEQPAVIACLHPRWAQPMFDEKGRLAVRLLWGGGMIGHWGAVIGPADMAMPPSDRGEQRLALRPGVYVWSGD
ncbi:MAG: hypothetical protein ACM3VT_07135 [Solirubrobacterales bacterium]